MCFQNQDPSFVSFDIDDIKKVIVRKEGKKEENIFWGEEKGMSFYTSSD